MAWQEWQQMALASQKAAQISETTDPRSCISRYYYAAYQAVTAVLLYQGTIPPAGREAWSHDATPGLLVEKWVTLLKLNERQDLARRLKELYKLRVSADYAGNVVVDRAAVKDARKDCNFLIRTVNGILPRG